jgi:hypothetical protein
MHTDTGFADAVKRLLQEIAEANPGIGRIEAILVGGAAVHF